MNYVLFTPTWFRAGTMLLQSLWAPVGRNNFPFTCIFSLGLGYKIFSVDVCRMSEPMNQPIFKHLQTVDSFGDKWVGTQWLSQTMLLHHTTPQHFFHKKDRLLCRFGPGKHIALKLSLQWSLTFLRARCPVEFSWNIKASLKMWQPGWFLWIWWSL